MPSPVQPANSISATSSGLAQWTPASLARRADAGERRLSARHRLQARQQRLDLRLAEAGADAADIDEMIAAMDADQQRAETARRSSLQPPITTSCPARHLALVQVVAAARPIGRVEPLGDDAFERQLAGRAQHRIAAGLEMLDKADQRAGRPCSAEQRLQALLALRQGQARADPRRRRTADRRRRRSGRRSCPPTAPPAARRNPARHGRPARRFRRR